MKSATHSGVNRFTRLAVLLALTAIGAACEQTPVEVGEKECATKYPIEVLREWHNARLSQVWSVSGVTATGINEEMQCLIVGVEQRSVTAQVEQRLGEIEIPRNAVLIFVSPPGHVL